ncbi:ABC transporter ATP-binding protein [Hyphomicrobium sp.]|uniref:ABC transporter ATP-binding protein n=1 Tax=Hyphomicrobium sp. TaxID=82 RepID=UPI000FA02BED|nr:ABC transporter ATP-binding protein [Hyphomicrobium sp.]RUO97632.1 MAG: ABC transporter ATP-binding protein [Hyphomicrobium sp.]
MSNFDQLLSVDRIFAIYNHSVAALHGVSLSVRTGEVRALLGANGAGKTTTLRAIANLLGAQRGSVTSGRIVFDGLDVLKMPPSTLVQAGLASVLEGRHVFKSLNVEENLIVGGLARGSRRSELSADLERIYALFPSLLPKRKIAAGLTSGGEQQMVAIGRALMSRPRLLILDEPSMGLAPIVVKGIFETLRALNRNDGLTILMAEQNAAIALRYADQATVIENGTDVLSDTADALRRGDYVKEFYLGSNVSTGIKREAGPQQPSAVSTSDELQTIAAE